MTEYIEDTLEYMTPALKQVFERAFYGVTGPNSSSAPSLPLDKIALSRSDFQLALWPGVDEKIDRDRVVDALATYSFERDLKASAILVGAFSSVDPWAEGEAIYTAQREAARIAIPMLSKNYEDQKNFIDGSRHFLQDARQAPLPTLAIGLTRGQVCDTIEARRERVDEAIRLFEEGTSLRKVGAQMAQPLGEQLDRGNKWHEDRGYDVGAHREIKTMNARVTQALSDIEFVSDKALKSKLSATGSDVRTKRKAGGPKHGSQCAAEGEPGSAVQKTSGSVARQNDGEDLEHVELKALLEDPEEQSKSGVYPHDDVQNELENQAGSQ
ncbi:hypothetical protein FS837_003452 [Tulasnella sp. UAMH 9824]|nr:hypothetical protein FS837_003452 [Tulasnella sp. UAMH 9824]